MVGGLGSIGTNETSSVGEHNHHHHHQQNQQHQQGIVTTTTTTVHKDKVIFRVKATYPYEAKELDELTFTKEDLIVVVEGTESEKEDLDDGWLIGIHEITNKRGLFPENFTKRI